MENGTCETLFRACNKDNFNLFSFVIFVKCSETFVVQARIL
jgi:hypothetical protein